MAYIETTKGKLHYSPKSIYLGIKQIDREIAFENFKVVNRVLNYAGIRFSPAYGTLLGIIRENNFIEWDEDIDLFILSEDKDRFVDALWTLKEEGLELIRIDRCEHLYSVMRNGEYIDFYIMDNISPEVRSGFGDLFMLERHLTDLIRWNFRGETINVPRQYNECLELLYGDWRTPVKYADFELNYMEICMAKFKYWLKNALPFKLRLYLLKKHHQKDLEKFLIKCKKNGITFNHEVKFN